jgi:hypothetical protein
VQTGLNLIFEWRQSLPSPSYTQTRIRNNSANLAVANPDLEQETLSNGLDKLSCTLTEPRPFTLSRPYFTSPEPYVVSPAPYVLEKELLQAFMQKDTQARTFCYWRPQIKHLRNLFSGPTQPTINTGMIASTHGTFGNSNEIIRGYTGYAELKSPVPIPPFFADLHAEWLRTGTFYSKNACPQGRWYSSSPDNRPVHITAQPKIISIQRTTYKSTKNHRISKSQSEK